MVEFDNTLSCAEVLDKQDSLAPWRQKFHLPQNENGDTKIYFCGNSLGLQPKDVSRVIDDELENWRLHAVEGHFSGERPWMHYHKYFTKYWQALIGCNEKEVVVMNNLTVNLHLLMVSFYRPTETRFKIIMEGHAFPSDQYAIASQVMHHGLDPDVAIVEIFPEGGSHTLSTSQILEAIEQHGEQLALVLFSGVQYYTGQFFDIKAITKASHAVGAYAGFDLAHAVGNVPLQLHDWQVDFATWCSYKYLNSGPGAVSGVYIHEKLSADVSLPRFAGWWGHDEKERFKMEKGFKPIPTAEGWQLSNAPVFNMAAHLASLKIFDEVGINKLRGKSLLLTAYLEYLLRDLSVEYCVFQVITPSDKDQRGCQLSLLFPVKGREIYNFLDSHDVVADWREPDVIRIAPVPLYNSFMDVFRFYQHLRVACTQLFDAER